MLTISEGRVFYHNVVFDIKADPDDPEFDVICIYSCKYAKVVFKTHGVGYHKPVALGLLKRRWANIFKCSLTGSVKIVKGFVFWKIGRSSHKKVKKISPCQYSR